MNIFYYQSKMKVKNRFLFNLWILRISFHDEQKHRQTFYLNLIMNDHFLFIFLTSKYQKYQIPINNIHFDQVF